MPSLLFSSFHNYLDPTSGAAISTRETLTSLVRNGWRVRAFCGSFFDARVFGERELLELISRYDSRPRVARSSVSFPNGRRLSFRLFKINDAGIDASFFICDGAFEPRARYSLNREIGSVFLRLLKDRFENEAPDVYATYGGYWAARVAALIAREAGAKTVFHLHNLNYDKAELFDRFDQIVVPSEFARRRYRERLNIESTVIPPIIDEGKVVADPATAKRRYATFINPAVEKGLYFFSGLARELDKERPDIPLLVVESRATASVFNRVADARRLSNLHYAPRVSAPSAIYAQTKVLLAPSVCEETFGRVVAEAAFNRIPTLCSDRGALPEIARGAGWKANLAREIPRRFNATSREVPTREEVQPWLDALVRLWDDSELLDAAGQASWEAAKSYSRAFVEEKTRAFYEGLTAERRTR